MKFKIASTTILNLLLGWRDWSDLRLLIVRVSVALLGNASHTIQTDCKQDSFYKLIV